MKKLILAVCLFCLAAPWAFAAGKHKGHAPEMSSIAMAVAGVTSLGGYLLVRRRAARHK